MTDLKFIVNGHDYSNLVTVRQYATNRIPVVATKYTDLAKIDHTTIARYKGTLKVAINPLSPTQAEDLYSDLMDAPCEVQYFSFQLQSNVTETMMPNFHELQDAKKRFGSHWMENTSIEFTQE